MNTQKRYPREVRERAVRMVLEHKGEYDSQGAAIGSVATKLGMTAETLRKWVRQAETDGGLRSGVTTEERARVKELERENRELRRANEILKAAAAFFGADLDRRQKRWPPSSRSARKSSGSSRSARCCRSPLPPTMPRRPAPRQPGNSATRSSHPRSSASTRRINPSTAPARYGGNSGDRDSRWPVARSSASCALWRTPTPAGSLVGRSGARRARIWPWTRWRWPSGGAAAMLTA